MSYESRRAEIARLEGHLPEAEVATLRKALEGVEGKSLDSLLEKIEGLRCKMEFVAAIRCIGLVIDANLTLVDFLVSLDYAMTALSPEKKKQRMEELAALTGGFEIKRRVDAYLKSDSGRYGSISEDRSRSSNPHKVHYRL